jgi:hypothetical protein
LANGRTSNTGVLRLMGRLLSSSGVIESTAFTVSAQGTPDMTVKVSGSTTSDNLVIITSAGDTYHGWNTANANVTISSNATGVSKRDAVVAYVDTALTTTTADNPGGLVLTTVRGSGTDTVPTDAEIDAAVSSKPWIRLANIFVANGASSINSGNITDTRAFATVDGKYLKAASVTPAKRTGGFKIGTIAAATLGSTGDKAVTGVGFTPKLVRFKILASANTSAATAGEGAMTSSAQYTTMIRVGSSGTQDSRYSSTSACIGYLNDGTSTPALLAAYKSMDADGFTITVSTASSGFDIAYEAYG